MEERKRDGRYDLWAFATKVLVVLIVLRVFVELALPSFARLRVGVGTAITRIEAQVEKVGEEERAALHALSLAHNPTALWKTSEIAEREGDLAAAIRDAELAIGLLEMHRSDKAIVQRYHERVARLKADPRLQPAAVPGAGRELKPAQ